MSPELALPLSAHSSALEVQKYPPILSAEEEHELAIQLYENHDLSAARKLVLSSDCDNGPKEIIKDGINGFLYKNRNMASFKKMFFIVFNLIKNKQGNAKEILLKGIKTSGNYSQLNHFKQIETHIR